MDMSIINKKVSSFATPFYLFDCIRMLDNITRLRNLFSYPETDFFYSLKTNDFIPLLRLLEKNGMQCEVESSKGLELARKIGFRKIIFNGVAKTSAELELACKKNDCIVIIDNLDELYALENITKNKIQVGLRIGIVQSHMYKFGMQKEDFIEAIKTLVDDEEKLALYSKFWLKKVSRYKTQQDLIDSLISFVFSDTGVENLRSTINNDSQLKLVFDDGELIVVRVLSYESLSNFAGDTSWCIKDSLSYWMDYIGNDNIQLVIINAEMPATSVEGKIGLTIYDGGRYNTAHRRNDSYIGEKELNQYLGNYGLSITELYDLSRGIGSNEYYSQDEISDDNYGGYNF